LKKNFFERVFWVSASRRNIVFTAIFPQVSAILSPKHFFFDKKKKKTTSQ